MSAYKKVECDIVDLDCLLKALELLGFTPTYSETPTNLYGYQNDIRKEVANVIIPKEQVNHFTGASNDIGFLWNEEDQKYDFIISAYDKKLNMHTRIIQAYVKVVLEQELEKNGYKIKVEIPDEQFLNRKISDLEFVARKII